MQGKNPTINSNVERTGRSNLWEVAILKARQKEVEDENKGDTTLIFVGSKSAGKTTLIYRFLNRDEVPKPTLALEYSFGRQARSTSLTKDVCHIWELGGGTLFTKLLEVPITAEKVSRLSLIVQIDLSAPNELLVTLETLLDELRSLLQKQLNSREGKQLELQEKLGEKTWERLGAEHPDKGRINPFPVPLVIIGGKYDVFQDMDPEKRKIICKTIRYIAHTNGATLQFFSSKIENLVNRTKVVIGNLAFGNIPSNCLSNDFHTPLIIPAGADSLQQIGGVDSGDNERLSSSTYATWKKTFEAYFPQNIQKIVMPEDPAKDPNFKEPTIDTLRLQKDEELEKFRKERERRRMKTPPE